MSLIFEHYWPLVLLALVPVLAWIRRDTVVDLSARHLRLSLLIRSGLIALSGYGADATDAPSIVGQSSNGVLAGHLPECQPDCGSGWTHVDPQDE